MSASKGSQEAAGSAVLGLLGIAFIVLKLTGEISWPWVLVLGPFWMPYALVLVVLIVVLIGYGIVTGVGSIGRSVRERKARK